MHLIGDSTILNRLEDTMTMCVCMPEKDGHRVECDRRKCPVCGVPCPTVADVMEHAIKHKYD